MKWKKYTIETTTAAEDYMSSMLMELGIEGIEITLQVVEIISGLINIFIVLFFIVFSLEYKSNTFKKVMNKLNFTENILCKFN